MCKETQEAKYTCLNFTKPDALDRLSVLGRSRVWRLHKCCRFYREGELICVLSRWSLHRCVSCVHRWRSNTPLPLPLPGNVPVNNPSWRQQLQRFPKRREVIVLLRGETPKPNIHVVLWATSLNIRAVWIRCWNYENAEKASDSFFANRESRNWRRQVSRCLWRVRQNRWPLCGRSRWPRGLRCGSAAARVLGLRVPIPPGAWMCVCCECCVFLGRGLCYELITRPEEFYQQWCVWMWSWSHESVEALTL